ncbi:MAG: hypothetical protein ABH879_10700 [archaeon]
MATPLDLGLLQDFSIIFSMLLVFALVYGILAVVKVFGDNKGLDALVAIVAALLILLAPNIGKVINVMVPWFVVMLIFVFFLLTWYMFMGADKGTILSAMKENRSITYWILILSVIILLGSLGTVYFTGEGGRPSSTTAAGLPINATEGDVSQTGGAAFWATLFHPKILGFILIMLIGTFTITLIAGPMRPGT